MLKKKELKAECAIFRDGKFSAELGNHHKGRRNTKIPRGWLAFAIDEIILWSF